MAEPFHMRHKGPYQLQLLRPAAGKRCKWSTECLAGSVDGLDCEAESMALLTDPRDCIVAVAVWSIPESQHVCTYRAGTK
jgi:hypothetical protein